MKYMYVINTHGYPHRHTCSWTHLVSARKESRKGWRKHCIAAMAIRLRPEGRVCDSAGSKVKVEIRTHTGLHLVFQAELTTVCAEGLGPFKRLKDRYRATESGQQKRHTASLYRHSFTLVRSSVSLIHLLFIFTHRISSIPCYHTERGFRLSPAQDSP